MPNGLSGNGHTLSNEALMIAVFIIWALPSYNLHAVSATII
jgi:hypothetical protein